MMAEHSVDRLIFGIDIVLEAQIGRMNFYALWLAVSRDVDFDGFSQGNSAASILMMIWLMVNLMTLPFLDHDFLCSFATNYWLDVGWKEI
jgi:hypothetical protein